MASEKKILASLPKSTGEIKVPKRIIDQVIGQDAGVEIIRKAAAQRRHVLLIGEPGTGKSMLGQGMSQLMPRKELEDVVVFQNADDENTPEVRSFAATVGKRLVDAARREQHSLDRLKSILFLFLFVSVAFITAYYFIVQGSPLVLFGGITASVFLLIGMRYTQSSKNIVKVPKLIVSHKRRDCPPFIDATGAHSGGLLGDVRHDPFQSGGLETPAYERVEAGAIHKANKGVLFIDEIATLSKKMQIELLTAMQERKYPITGRSERSSGSMVKTEPVPCDFVLVAAGNLPTLAKMNPALRSRIRGYGYEVFVNESMPDTKENEKRIVRFIAQEIAKDGKIPHFDKGAIETIVLEARRRSERKGHLTLKLRELGGLVRAAGDVAVQKGDSVVTRKHVVLAKYIARTLEQQVADKFIEKKKEYSVIQTEGAVIGRVNGLAVIGGSESGIVLPIEAEVTPGGEKAEIIATGGLGNIAKEAIQNVNAVIMNLYGKDLKESSDIYVQFLQTYEGVEGDSASVAVATAVISAYKKLPVNQSVGMTGSLSVRGDVLPVGGVNAKIEAAIGAGLKKVLVPAANINDIMIHKHNMGKVEIVPVARIEDVLRESVLAKKPFFSHLKKMAAKVIKRRAATA